MMTRVDATITARRTGRLAGWLTCALALAGALLVPSAALAAGAGNANTVLIDATGSATTGAQRTEALALGFTVEQVTDPAVWNAKTEADFKTYKAIILPDNTYSGISATAIASRATWSRAILGNILIIGGDPEYHYNYGYPVANPGGGPSGLIRNGIKFVADDPGKTGLYVAIPFASSASVLDPFGSFGVGTMSSDSVHIVAVHPALEGLTDALLSNWGSSTHLKFTSFPANFVPLAIQTNGTNPGVMSFADGTSGTPFLLVRGSGVQPVGLNLGASGPSTVASGTPFTYTLTYGNTGGTGAPGVTITAPIPTGTTFVSATGGGSLSEGAVTWSVGSLAAHTTGLTVTYTVTPAAAGTTTMSGARITDGTNTTTAADVTTTVTAPPTGITVSGGTAAYGYPGSAVVVDPGVLVEAPSNLDNATVSIGAGFMAGQDVLSFTGSGGITGSYNSTTGVLTLSGNASAAAYQAVLRTVTYSNTGSGASAGTRTIAFSLGSGLNYSGTGHFYEFVSASGITWDDAKAAAAARTYFGLRGYLVTVTSAGENAFVKAKLAQNAWMGLSTPSGSFPRTWYWDTGPEAGTAIFTNSSAGAGTAIGGAYTNWDGGEPNSSGGIETKGHFYAATGLWNDFSPTNSSIGGYVVEYGGTSGDPSVVLTGSRGVVVSISIPTTTTVASSAPGAVWGHPVTFTATISPAAGGTVQFRIDGSSFGSPVSVSGGVATSIATSSLSVADHTISAVYSGDSSHIGSSGSYGQTVVRAGTTIELGSSVATTIYRSSVTLTAEVAITEPGSGTPTGTVAFDADGVPIAGCTAQAVSGGETATCVTSALPVGVNTVHATYSGDTHFVGAGPHATLVEVTRATPSVAIASSANPSVFGSSVTFTATASGVGVTPTGTVVFREGETTFCTTTLSAGVASCTVALLSTPSHAITVAYAGDGNYLPVSPTYAQTVNKAPTSTALAAAPTPSTYGQVVTLTATVTGPAITPSGTIAFTDGGATISGCSARAMSAGVATCVLPSTLIGGSHAFAAAYSGDGSFLTSSGSASHTVNRATPTLALATSKPLSTYGEPVTFTVTASYGVGGPTGQVSVMDGATVICGPVTLAEGTASCGSRVVTVGTHALTASYVGDGNFTAATSPALTQLQVRGTTTSDVVADMSQSVYGQPVTLTATVYPDSPSVEVPTGTITFRDSSTAICTDVALSVVGGVATATCTTSSLSVNWHALSGRYNGSPGYSPSTSFSYAVKVNQAATQVALAASPASSVFGQPVTFTITVPAVAPGAGVATGTVSLTDGGSAVAGCTDLPLSGASASCSTATFAVGSHALGVSYGGDGNFLASTSTPTYTVAKAATSTSVATSPTPSRFGQGVTFTATVAASAPGAGSPSGTVTFRANGTAIGTGTISGGVASFATSSLVVASHAITAVYSGDGSFLTSTSSSLAQVVDKASVLVTLSPVTPSAFGQTVSFSVSVTAVSPGAGTPSGTVVLTDGGTTIGTVTLSGGAGSMSTSALAVGSHGVTASYGGDSSFLAGSAGATQVVNKANTATVLLSSAPTSKFGQVVTLTATVGSVAPGAGTPTGTVTIEEGSTRLCGPLTLSGGSASCDLSTLAVGPHALTATYSGSSSQLAGTAGALTQTVARADTTLVMDEPPPTSLYGEPIVLTTHVAPVAPGAGLPAGTVEFYDNETLLGSATVDAITGVATFTVLSSAPLSVGSHAFLATYGGDVSFTGSMTERSIAHTVDPGSVLVALSFSPASAVWGQPVEVQVSVSAIAPAVGIPEGTVEIVEGGVVIQTLTLEAGAASWTTSAFTVATHELTAHYLGVTEWLPETSPAGSLVVEKAATATALALSPSATVFGQPVTLTATVTVAEPGAGSPSGTVTFRDGSTVLGTGAVDPATGLATISTAALAVGSHGLAATYEGDVHFTSSVSAPSTLEVTKASVSVVLASSLTPSVFGQRVTFSVSVTAVSPGAGTPSGTVTLTAGSTTIGTLMLSGGRGSFSTSYLGVAIHAITASYGGDASFGAGSGATTQVVNRAASSLAFSSDPRNSAFGQEVSFTASLTAVAPGAGVPTGAVTIEEGGTPVCGPLTLSGGTASCSLSTLAVGTHAITATYAGDANYVASTSTITLVVARAGSSMLVSSTPSPSMYGQSVTLAALVSAVAPRYGQPTGSVTFYSGATALGSAQLDEAGRATFTLSTLAAGEHVIIATYGGDGSFLPSRSTTFLGHSVAQGTASLELASSRNPSRRGRPVVLTATVTSPHATPSGAVTFKDGDAVLGTGTLEGGVATLTVRSLVKGTHAITADYASVADFSAAQGTLLGGQLVENTPPVAGSGTSLGFGPAGASAVTVGDPRGLLAVSGGTVEAWVKPSWTTAAQVGGTPTILRLGPADAPRYALGVSADRQRLVVTSSAGVRSYPAPLDDGGWHHVVLQSSGGSVRALVDGIEVADATGAFADASGDLVLGEGFLGELDEVRAWSTARSAAELSASQRRPLRGDEPGLVGCWRMDEAAGVEIFDASPSQLDGAVALAEGAATAFLPSAAWRHRLGQQERPLSPVDAGYDADGDPLSLAVVTAALHGAATASQAALQVDYRPAAAFLGDDRFTFSLTDDEAASSSYTVDVTIERILLCQANLDCGGGDLCVQGVCTAGAQLDGRSGGCSSGSTNGAASLLWALLALGLLARGRRATLPPAARRFLAVALVGGAAATAQAQVTPPPSLPAGFDAQLFEPAPAGDPFFAVAGTGGHLAPAAGLVLSWATEPMVLRRDGHVIPGGRLIHRQLWGWAVGSLTFLDRVVVDVAAPVALHQTGSRPYTDLAVVDAAGLGDVRLGARVQLPWGGPFDLAAGLSVWLPTGSRSAFASDGEARVAPKLMGSGQLGNIDFGAELGLTYRPAKRLAITELGSAISFAAGAAYRWDSFRVGPELYGNYQFKGSNTSPVELLFGGHYERGAFDYGAGIATGLNRAPAASPLRLVGQVTWQPGRVEAARRVAEARAAAEQAAAEKAAADQLAADQAGAAWAERVVAEQAAADRAAADRLAAEQAAAATAAAAAAAAGAGAQKPALAKLTRERIEILQSIQFESSRSVIRAGSEPLLRDVAGVLRDHPEVARVRIEGHTDSQGPAGFNTRLSGERATSVMRWLVDQGGVDPSRLGAEGFGSDKPVATNDTVEGRARNRRVEFNIVAAP